MNPYRRASRPFARIGIGGLVLGTVALLGSACSAPDTEEMTSDASDAGSEIEAEASYLPPRLVSDSSVTYCTGERCKESWSIVILPDTQHLSLRFPHVFHAQTSWIAERRQVLNIKYVLHVGDVVHNVTLREWTNAKRAMSVLDRSGVPYAIVTGNHDLGSTAHAEDRSSLFIDDRFFGPGSDYARQPTLLGFFDAVGGRTDTSYHRFEAGGQTWLVLALEFAPRDGAIEWALDVVRREPHDHAILLTHAHLYSDGSRYDRLKEPRQRWNPPLYKLGSRPDAAANDGQQLYDKLVAKHDRFRFVICGHALGSGVARISGRTPRGNVVHELMANFQAEVEGSRLGGEGFLRVLGFREGESEVTVQTFSPLREMKRVHAFKRTPDHEFTVSLDSLPDAGEPGRD